MEHDERLSQDETETPAFSIYDPTSDHVINIFASGRVTGLQGYRVCHLGAVCVINRIPALILKAAQSGA